MVSDDYTVRLEQVFQGPMDLLLHLVREQEVEIHEIEISKVIEGYLGYVKNLQVLDIELAGEFMVMAASLMVIKVRSLLPREEIDLAEELDPRDELIERLIEYRRFKGAADDLGDRFRDRLAQQDRGHLAEADDEQGATSLDLGELTYWDLLATFSRLMRETLADQPHRVASDPRPMRFYVAAMARAIHHHETTSLRKILTSIDNQPNRETLVGSFCALLELIRLGVVCAKQTSDHEDIWLEIVEERVEDVDILIRSTQFEDELVSRLQDADTEGADIEGAHTEAEEVSEAQKASAEAKAH